MRILWAVCGWGLGHATRSLPVLREHLERDVGIALERPGLAGLMPNGIDPVARVLEEVLG